MKSSSLGVAQILVLIFLMVCLATNGLRLPLLDHQASSIHGKATKLGDKGQMQPKEEVGMEVYPSGSSLPDCSHACGPCFPCKRVMVSFKCSMAESCPIVYRCMCKGKYYHVPSN